MITFEEWFPLVPEIGTVAMFLITLLLVMAGTVVGITIKELEVWDEKKANPHFNLASAPNKILLILGGALSVGFWIANIGAIECFTYSTVIKTGLGTLRNVMDKRSAKP